MDKQSAEDRRFHRANLIWPLVLILVVTLFSLLKGNSGSTVVTQIDSGLLGIADAVNNTFIPLSDITSVDLVSGLNVGAPLSEEANSVEYCNDEFGTYLLYACKKDGPYVVIRLADQVVVVRAKNEKSTERFYEELTQALANPV